MSEKSQSYTPIDFNKIEDFLRDKVDNAEKYKISIGVARLFILYINNLTEKFLKLNEKNEEYKKNQQSETRDMIIQYVGYIATLRQCITHLSEMIEDTFSDCSEFKKIIELRDHVFNKTTFPGSDDKKPDLDEMNND